jgi:hypothetical protein
MKKAIIYGYFIGMCVLTYFMFHIGVWVRNSDGEIELETHDNHLSIKEAKEKGFTNPTLSYAQYIRVQYTMHKNMFGYEIQKDTLNVTTYQKTR